MEDTAKDDKLKYEQLQAAQQKAWEGACKRCGACCGVDDGDPCEHLREAEGVFFLQYL